MEIKKYPDGTSYAVIPAHIDLAEEESCFTYRVNSYEDLWHLGQLLEAFNHKGIVPNVTIPNLIDAQADRRFGSMGVQSSGLKMVCDFLNQFDAIYQVYHPHNPEVLESLLGSKVEIFSNTLYINNVIGKVNKNNLILMSADAGGFKPLIKLCDQLNWKGDTYSASKARDPKTGKLTQLIDREDFGGKDILIVDDICVYGGTFKGLSKLLRERNCGKLYLAVSHMTIQHLGKDPVTNYFDKVFTTNSKFNHYYCEGGLKYPENLEIINIFNFEKRSREVIGRL